MTDIGGLRHFELAFGPGESPDRPAALGGNRLIEEADRYRDIFVYAPGWHATKTSARAMTTRVLSLLAGQLGERVASSAAVLVDWPHFLFPEDDPHAAVPATTGGNQLVASLGLAFPHRQFQLEEIADLLDRQPGQLADLRRFHALAVSLVTSPSQALEDSGPATAISADPLSLFAHAVNMSKTSSPETDASRTLWAGAREALRILAYYEMSNRAGMIGRYGLGPVLARLPDRNGQPRVHLIGHSFGARLVAYALAGLSAGPAGGDTPFAPARSPVRSMYLMQAAFSHFAFSDDRPIDHARHGALAQYASRVRGPLITTFSSHDRFLGWWYPTASMLNHEASRSAGELAYRWGAMGFDGLQGPVPLDVSMRPDGSSYDFRPGLHYRLDASRFVNRDESAMCGAHSDIARPEVIWPVVEASAAAAGRH